MPSLDGVRAKLARANEHLARLESDTHAFLENEPYRFALEVDGHDYVVRIKASREPPIELAIMLGDVLYNLRSSLDHLAWQLASLNGKPPAGTEFPIFKDRGKFTSSGRSGGLYKIRGLGPSTGHS